MEDLIESIIRSSIMNQYVYSKVKFDNAKDTNQLIVAANENADMLTKVLEYEVRKLIDELLIAKIESVRKDGQFVVKVGDTLYRIEEY